MTVHPDDLLGQIEQRAAQRFVHWDPAVWTQVLDGPARKLSEALVQEHSDDHARDVLTSYLTLASHGVGLGYLFDGAETNTENFLVRAWFDLIPSHLARLPRDQQAKTLADLWNLGENLENSPPWLRRVFLHLSKGLDDLADLETLVTKVERAVSNEPETTLEAGVKTVHWIRLADADPWFLPGPAVFMGPTLVCLQDRLRTDADGNALTLGVWLDEDAPVFLGSMGPQPIPDDWIAPEAVPLWEDLDDPRSSPLHACARNAWRATFVMETSQYLVALAP